MATILDIAGVEKPDYVEFKSLLGLIHGNEEQIYEDIYGAYLKNQRMIKKDGYKLTVYPKAKKILLFDMENDPFEMNDLADQSEYQEKIKKLFTDLQQKQIQLNDALVLNAADYDI
jgi:arylsulfatase A-like enzyme